QWLRQGIAAVQGLANEDSPQTDAFYRGKLLTLDYFFEYELPKIQSLRSRLLSSNHLTVELEEAWLEEV
ncbi:MAG: acyl-CoA dehydrogenase, partial [Bacteroidetes bacterium]